MRGRLCDLLVIHGPYLSALETRLGIIKCYDDDDDDKHSVVSHYEQLIKKRFLSRLVIHDF